jgi:hypothetical protein
VGRGERSPKDHLKGGGRVESPCPRTSATAARETRARIDSHDGLLDLQAEIVEELLYGGCTDNRVRALQAAQRGLTICREIVTDREEIAHVASLDRNTAEVARQLGGQVGGVLTTDEAPPFDPSGGAKH